MIHTYNARSVPKVLRSMKNRKHKRQLYAAVIVMAVLLVYVSVALLRPLGTLRTVVIPPITLAQVKVSVPWPSNAQAAFGRDGSGVLSTNMQQSPRPIGGIATVIAAMAVLEKQPLKAGQQGPDITFTQRDEALFDQYVAGDNNAIPVAAGSSVSEYQALQAMLLPAANNVVDSTVLWAFGSMPAYTSYATAMAKRMGMTQTTVTDASGLSPTTTSTAADLIKLGDRAVDYPVLREIFGQTSAVFPGYGTIATTNSVLGQNGIRGIKATQTPDAGGCFLAAADISVAGAPMTVISAVLGAASRDEAMKNTEPLIKASVSAFNEVRVVRTGQPVGTATAPWGAKSDIIATQEIKVFAWSGKGLAPTVSYAAVPAPAVAGTRAGKLSLDFAGTTRDSKLVLASDVGPPSIWWRLTHP